MKLVTFAPKNNPSKTQIGILEGSRIIETEPIQDDLLGLIHQGITPGQSDKSVALTDTIIKAPFRPAKIIGVGRNYAAHAKELDNELPEAPLLFAKLSSSVIGHGETIVWSKSITSQVDWEGELAVIIGKTAKNVDEANAMDYVFSYTIANDVSARDLQQNDGQWVRAKGLDTFCPLGPCIVTRDEISDPDSLTIKTTVNGQEMQNSSTSLMMFKIPYLVSYCSQAFTLNPGDIILTGTPAGVGKGMKPPKFLQSGDIVTIKIDDIGKLTNTCRIEK